MAIQPNELEDVLGKRYKEACDRMEKEIDEKLKKEWNGRYLEYNPGEWFGEHLGNSPVLKELKKRYHGWTVTHESGSDPREQYSWSHLKLTPKKKADPRPDAWPPPDTTDYKDK